MPRIWALHIVPMRVRQQNEGVMTIGTTTLFRDRIGAGSAREIMSGQVHVLALRSPAIDLTRGRARFNHAALSALS